MRLNVVVPNHNGAKTIVKCLQSIFAQNIAIEQVLVVDDASDDGSVALVKEKFPSVEVVESKKNLGAAKARNIGINSAKGDLLLFVDSDVYLLEECINKMLKKASDFSIVYPTVLYEDGSILSPAYPCEKEYIRRSPVFLIKKNELAKLDEMFDENYFIYYEDIDFFVRCYLAGLGSSYESDAIAKHAILSGSRDVERRFYLETKNRIYSMIKFWNLSKHIKEIFLLPSYWSIISAARTAWKNKNIYNAYPDHAGDNRLSKTRIRAIVIFLKAVLWNFFALSRSLSKQRKIKIKR